MVGDAVLCLVDVDDVAYQPDAVEVSMIHIATTIPIFGLLALSEYVLTSAVISMSYGMPKLKRKPIMKSSSSVEILMKPVIVKPYLSPTLVLLTFDWEEAPQHPDFLGFAIRRTPGFRSAGGHTVVSSSWLPNRIGFNGAVPENQPDLPSNVAPIQKFMWWDNRIDTPDIEGQFIYEIWPVCGTPNKLELQEHAKAYVTVKLPAHVNANGIGTWFNRAVIRSQAFGRICKHLGIDQSTTPTPQQDIVLRTWLGNGMEKVVPDFLDRIGGGVGAIYHLTDAKFIIPAFARNNSKPLWMVYDEGSSVRSAKSSTNPNLQAVDVLGKEVMRAARRHTTIMHNKFIVAGDHDGMHVGPPARVITGSANYTTGGLTEQANLIHTIESPGLAQLYLARANLLLNDPGVGITKKESIGWSAPVKVGGASIRVNFSPEPNSASTQLTAITDAITKATHSVLFCLFSPADKDLRRACFSAGDRGLMMFGLTNRIGVPSEDVINADPEALQAGVLAGLELYHRSKNNMDVIDARFFNPKNLPDGFSPEFNLYPGAKPPPYPPVIIHHKFILIDAETDHPVIYTGSANMSRNSVHNNDENLLEIKGDTALAAVYLSEFMRLYEHYRARAHAIGVSSGKKSMEAFKLRESFAEWGQKYFKEGSAEEKARRSLVYRIR